MEGVAPSETVEIGLEQVLMVDPWLSRGQTSLQFSTEGLAKGFSSLSLPPNSSYRRKVDDPTERQEPIW